MCMNDEILENALINFVASKFAKAPFKLNNMHESDAEIIDTGNSDGNLLAVSIDSLAEELTSGLYDDPYLAGWMLATVNLSDLAAVGAKPLGILISLTLKSAHDTSFIDSLSQGLADACEHSNTFILGGDTNQGDSDYLSGCALGLVTKGKIMSRIGARPGDRLYLTAPAGGGNMFAFGQLSGMKNGHGKINYKPYARLDEAQLIREYASCCIDTSDGVIHAVDTIMRLNNVGIVMYSDWGNIIDRKASEICSKLNLPSWSTLAGVHGEFELCFTIPSEKKDLFLQKMAQQGWSPVLLGEIMEGRGVFIRQGENDIMIDTTTIRNLSHNSHRNIHKYIESLIELADKTGIH